MNLERLHEFVVLAEQGSLGTAASILHLAPATLTARLRAFEESIDARLLVFS